MEQTTELTATKELSTGTALAGDEFATQYGPWALVTGASAGIGEEFARQLAANGLNLALVARRADRLHELASELERANGIQVRVIQADLSRPDAVANVQEATEGLEIGLLVNNAGAGNIGRFLDQELHRELDFLALNVTTPVALTHQFAGQMQRRRRGGIIFLSSVIGFAGTPYMADYASAKSFIRLFGHSLAYELEQDGVDTLVLTPGGTNTEWAERMMGERADKTMPAEKVVATALKGLGHKREVVPGASNRLMVQTVSRLMPRKAAANFNAKFLEKNLGELTKAA